MEHRDPLFERQGKRAGRSSWCRARRRQNGEGVRADYERVSGRPLRNVGAPGAVCGRAPGGFKSLQACAGYVREHGVFKEAGPGGARAEELVVDAAIESPIVIEGYWHGDVPAVSFGTIERGENESNALI
jgi:hypothetical protein